MKLGKTGQTKSDQTKAQGPNDSSKKSSPSRSRRVREEKQGETKRRRKSAEGAEPRAEKENRTMTETEFMTAIGAIQESLIQVRKATTSISELQAEGFFDPSAKTTSKIENLVQTTNAVALENKSNLMCLAKKVAEEREEAGEAHARMRQNLLHLVTRQFKEAVENYQAAQESYKASLRKNTERRARICNPDVTDEEVESILRNEDGLQKWYRGHFLMQADPKIQDHLNQAHDTYKVVRQLERSMEELHGMFLDLALLTEDQGQLLDQIEFQVKQANDAVEDGNVNTFKAISYQDKIRRKKRWIIVIVGVVVIVVVVLLF